jgi:hypothetical protein
LRLQQEQIRRLAEALADALVKSGGAELKAEQGLVTERIAAIIGDDLDRERDLDREAQRLLETHLRQAPPGVDRHKLLQMIKRRLAEERGIPL